VYEQMMSAQMTAEFDRRKAIEGRGAAILTTSTTMLTLIFGLVVIVTGKNEPFKNQLALWLLTAALGALVVSALFAIVVQTFGFKHTVPSRQLLNGLTGSHWSRSEDDARRMWVRRQVLTTLSLRSSNNLRATLVVWSLRAQVVAIALLAASVGVELWSRLSATS
jgi:hypothetical protein